MASRRSATGVVALRRLFDSIKFRVVLAASLLFTLIAMAAALILIQGWVEDFEQRRPPELAEALGLLCEQVYGSQEFSQVGVGGDRPVVYRVESPSGLVDTGYLRQGRAAASPTDERCTAGGAWTLTREGSPPDGRLQMALTRKVVTDEGEWDVRVASTTTAAPDDVLTMVQAARVAIPGLVLIVAVLLWLVTAEALKPVNSLIKASTEISLGTLDQRLPRPRHADEIAELTDHLNSMFDRLEAANRSQQQFVSDASHELRSPVATILAISERGDLGAADVSMIHAEASRLSGLIDSLLELARVQEGAPVHREQIELHRLLLEDAERVLVPAERKGVTVDTTAVGRVTLHANRGALTGVVRNLVDNALRHTRSEVALVCRTQDDTAVIEVHDDGPGVPAEMRDAVFERFVRLDDGRSRGVGGTGLGLALVKDLVEAHGGEVSAGASFLGGAVFSVVLPLVPDEPDEVG